MSGPSRIRAVDRTRDEKGLVLPLLGLLLSVLMIFAALSVDVGSWYARASAIQRTADASALAGVIWMPDLATARTVARDTAARNGFVHGKDDINVQVNSVPGNAHQLQVVIDDGSVNQYFSKVVIDRQKIGRSATAEYVLPVPLGSPKNTFGTGDLLSGSDRENFWAAVSGWCSGRENGDLRLPIHDQNYRGGFSCDGLAPNPTYDPGGYMYSIGLAQAPSQSVRIEVFDPGYNPDNGSSNDSKLSGGRVSVTTTYVIYDVDNTPLDPYDNPEIYRRTFTSNNGVGADQWVTLYTITNPKAGQYYMRIFTQANERDSQGSNSFGLRARVGSTFVPCTTIRGLPGYSASCPQVHGVDAISLFANEQGSQADFFLAEVDEVHAGKTMELELFDPGEGASSIRVLDPNGNPVSFTWRTACNPPTPPNGGCSGSGNALDVSGSGPQPYPNLGSSSRYSDRTILLSIALPNDYATRYGGKKWWKIRYNTGSGRVTDRTTWSVNIIGDPVHLVD